MPMHRDRLLRSSAYIALIAVAVVGVWQAYQDGPRWPVAALMLAAFGILMTFAPESSPARACPVPAWQAHAFLALEAAIACALTLAFRGGGSLYLILLFIVGVQAMLLSERSGILWVVGLAVITAASMYAVYGVDGLLGSLPMAGGYLFFTMFASALRRADAARFQSEQLLAQLQEAHRQLQQYSARSEQLAVAEERNRLAREMHDSLGHRLTVSAVQLEGAQRLIAADPERAGRMVGTAREQVREALADLRRTVATLRSPLEADLPLESALQQMADRFRDATGIPVGVSLQPLPSLSAAQRHTLYRAVQEGLTNVQKHAHATHVHVAVAAQDSTVTATVMDDGGGPGEAAPGFGLAGLRERAGHLGGTVSLAAAAGGGAVLTMRLPLAEEEVDG
jgi:signal transduction histidine kinase